VDPVPEPLLFFVVPGIEPGPPDLQPSTLATRPQRLSHKIAHHALTAHKATQTIKHTLHIMNTTHKEK
jgi:hypothetical protein